MARGRGLNTLQELCLEPSSRRNSSAALGPFRFARTAAPWTLVSSTVWTGRTDDRELIIDLDAIRGGPKTLAVLHATDESIPEYSHWPPSLDEDYLDEKLMGGRPSQAVDLQLTGWARLVLSQNR